ncbi:TonB-dependent receptor [Sphingobium sp. KCTC 72723]|uniref:TonB-dependent receptor n=1 Tax=Sphingobium sp. KCTC 72723 TaxID=2733867 RepID=UPI00165DBBC4|nr:TonB-dependent receptor [Sphingobium sp. KCTC 72723]
MNQFFGIRHARAVALASVATIFVPAPTVFAQEPAQTTAASPASGEQADKGGLADIVVTAQKRSERVQDVPIAISAFSSQALASKGVTEIAAVGNLAPNVTLDAGTPFSGSSSVLSAYIRGIGQNDFAFNLDPGVGIYLDGVYLARSVGANQDLLDIERIEILKGPQGDLFGRNSIGGAISIVTRRPSDTFAAKAEVTTGRFNRIDVKGAIDVPLTSDLRSTLSFSTKNRDGYQKLLPYPGATASVSESDSFPSFGRGHPNDFGGFGEYTVRGKLEWQATLNIRATLTGDYLHQNTNGVASSILKTHTDIATGGVFGFFYNTCINTPAAILATLPFGKICGLRANVGTPLAGVNVDGVPGNDHLTYGDQFIAPSKDTTYATGNSFSRLNNYGGALTVDWDLGGPVLKSITSYRELRWKSAQDEDGSPLAFLETSFEMNQHQFSQEFQLTGKAVDDRLSYVAGLYYFNEGGNLHDLVTFPGGLLQIDGQNLLSTKAYAAYAHLNYKITEQVSITLGGRYTEEKKQFEGLQADPNGTFYKLNGLDPTPANRVALCTATGGVLCYPDLTDVLRIYPLGKNRLNFSNFSPKIGLEYKPSRDVMLYASYSRGYKTGGWTTRLTQPPALGQTAPSFGPEKANTFDGGIKSQFLDRKVVLNVSGFHTDYKNIQLTAQVGTSPTIVNAGNAEIYGFEVELQARPVEALTLSASVGYTHARYTNVLFGASGVTTASSLPKTPEWKFNFSPQYVVSLGSGGSVLFTADYTHTSSLFNDTENTVLIARGATDMLNASVTYREPSEHWELSIGGTNLLNERYLTTGQNQVAGGVTYGTYSRPVEWYATARVKF